MSTPMLNLIFIAIWALPGYTFLGVHKEIRKLFGTSVTNYIISARTAQGYEQWKSSKAEERLDIITKWHEHKVELQSTKQKIHESGPDGQGSGRLSPKGFLQTRHLSFEERKKLHEERLMTREHNKSKTTSENVRHQRNASSSQTTLPSHLTTETEDEFEHAIQASVASTSRGDQDEDAMIERAIRASVQELQKASGSTLTEQEALDRAIQASINEAGRNNPSYSSNNFDSFDAEHSAILQRSLRESLNDTEASAAHGTEVDTDDDEDIKRAIEASKSSQPKTEEESVLEYVKKQSIAEEKHRQAMQGTRRAAMEDGDDDDDDDDDDGELKKAIEESMKTG